ncbi:MAG: glycosyltransferase family 2 protein [bacterium]
MDISLVIPVFNEEENVESLYKEISDSLEKLPSTFEVIFIDDGSIDSTASLLKTIAMKDERVKLICLSKNFGQTSAMSAGFDQAQGRIIIPLDGDGQNNPADIPRMVEKIDEGYDVVSGWRKNRKDKLLTRRIPSMTANLIISLITGVHLHDYGCTLKAYRKEIIKNIRLYGEMHRFIPVYASSIGAKLIEIEVDHRHRVAGKSKYGIFRTFKVMLDLFTVKFLGSYATSPIYFFGIFGAILSVLGVLSGAVTIVEKYTLGTFVHKNPLILLAIFLFTLGFQFILIGLLAELLIRIYHESQNKSIYIIREIISLTHQDY